MAEGCNRDSNSCDMNWLDQEPDRESSDYDVYILEGILFRPTEEEYKLKSARKILLKARRPCTEIIKLAIVSNHKHLSINHYRFLPTASYSHPGW